MRRLTNCLRRLWWAFRMTELRIDVDQAGTVAVSPPIPSGMAVRHVVTRDLLPGETPGNRDVLEFQGESAVVADFARLHHDGVLGEILDHEVRVGPQGWKKYLEIRVENCAVAVIADDVLMSWEAAIERGVIAVRPLTEPITIRHVPLEEEQGKPLDGAVIDEAPVPASEADAEAIARERREAP